MNAQVERQESHQRSNEADLLQICPLSLRPLSPEPLVSVIIANHNYARFLSDAVESILSQTYAHFELLICDDGSTDDSRLVLEELCQRDGRIEALYKDNNGQASALSHAFQYSSGEIISFLDADDWFAAGKLQRVVDVFRRHTQTGLVYHRFQPTTTEGTSIGPDFPSDLASGWLADSALSRGGWGPETITSVLSIRREIADELFPLPPDLGGFGDAFIQGTSQLLTRIDGIPEPLTLYRIHGANDSGSLRPGLAEVTAQAEGRRRTFGFIRDYVASRWGEDVARQLHLEDIPSYWEYLAALYVLSGKPSAGVHGFSRAEILCHLPDSRRKQIWRCVFALPGPVSRRAFQAWWGQAWWKPIARRVARRLGAVG